MEKNDAEIMLEIFQSVMQSDDKQKRLKSTTFWKLFSVKSRQKSVLDRISLLAEKQGLKFTIKSGCQFGEEKDDDWIIITPTIVQPSSIPLHESEINTPSKEWFNLIRTRKYESEREVEAYFLTELVEKLGYTYDDISIGYSLQMFKGVQKTTVEADCVLFRDEGRDKKNVLMVIEAKKSDKGITVDHISQVQSYAKELFPASFIITNGEQIKVYQFNGLLAPDECVLDFNRQEIEEKWNIFYGTVCKDATIKRKDWLLSKIEKKST
jgi:hypothetical protein